MLLPTVMTDGFVMVMLFQRFRREGRVGDGEEGRNEIDDAEEGDGARKQRCGLKVGDEEEARGKRAGKVSARRRKGELRNRKTHPQ